jgi:uncharacterized Zn finger protein
MYYNWYYYPRSKPIPVDKGIRTKSKHGEIGEKWWSKKWIQTLESFDIGERLQRGRSYARRGQVISLDIQKGMVTAKVQGSRPNPYSVKIQLKKLDDGEWDRVAHVLASKAIFAAKLLAGEMPNNIEEAFSAANVSIFPRKGEDLETECTCPDWSNPCKHIAAVYYILAERFDEDPFLIFKLRGRTKEEVIEILRKIRNDAYDEATGKSSRAKKTGIPKDKKIDVLRENVSDFWLLPEGLETFRISPEKPEVDNAIIKRLGTPPFGMNSEAVSKILSKIYNAASERALREIMKDEDK